MDQLQKELVFRTARSSGAGGQHVNKVETKVDVIFDFQKVEWLSLEQKERIKAKLKNRINKDGLLILSNQSSRSQLKNKTVVVKELHRMLLEALKPEKKRKKVKQLVANKEKRLKNKKIKAERKAERKKPVI